MSTESVQLHLGCGREILPGWINLDITPLPGVDIVADLDNCMTTSLPFRDDSIGAFLASHVLEHLHNPLPFMQELHRIARPGARAKFCVPYGSSDEAHEDPTHVRPYFANSFYYFSQPCYWRTDYGYRGDWAVQRLTFLVDASCEGLSDQEIMQRVRSLRNIVRELSADLRAVKPIREPNKDLIDTPRIEFKYRADGKVLRCSG